MPTLRTLARLRSRSGERNSSARGVIASQPTNAQKSWTAAKPTAGQPNGASGANASARTSRTDASTTTTTSPSTPTVATACAAPTRRRPRRFSPYASAMNAPAMTNCASRPRANGAARYDAARSPTKAVPVGTCARKSHPAIAPQRVPNARTMYAVKPPATGCRRASAANVSASGSDSSDSPAQATSDAGPAVSAATAGSTRMPVPRTAPT